MPWPSFGHAVVMLWSYLQTLVIIHTALDSYHASHPPICAALNFFLVQRPYRTREVPGLHIKGRQGAGRGGTIMARKRGGTLPEFTPICLDGGSSLDVITADVAPSLLTTGRNGTEHGTEHGDQHVQRLVLTRQRWNRQLDVSA